MMEEIDANRLTLVRVFTDGACSGNPGPGAWAALLRFENTEKEIAGGERLTTNNRMELVAVIEGLQALRRPCKVELYTDSKYVVMGINEWVGGKGKAINFSYFSPYNVIQEPIETFFNAGKENKKLTVMVALSYGGRQEITEAIHKIVRKIV